MTVTTCIHLLNKKHEKFDRRAQSWIPLSSPIDKRQASAAQLKHSPVKPTVPPITSRRQTLELFRIEVYIHVYKSFAKLYPCYLTVLYSLILFLKWWGSVCRDCRYSFTSVVELLCRFEAGPVWTTTPHSYCSVADINAVLPSNLCRPLSNSGRQMLPRPF